MRYQQTSPLGPIAACILALVATVGSILAPQGNELSWIAMFLSSGMLFGLTVSKPKFTGKRFGDD